MILGMGVDIVHLPVFEGLLESEAFLASTFTQKEVMYARSYPPGIRQNQALAARYAAKEAFIKAFDMARGDRVGAPSDYQYRDIEVAVRVTDINGGGNNAGVPDIVVHGSVQDKVRHIGITRTVVSLSHDGPSVVAVVILL